MAFVLVILFTSFHITELLTNFIGSGSRWGSSQQGTGDVLMKIHWGGTICWTWKLLASLNLYCQLLSWQGMVSQMLPTLMWYEIVWAEKFYNTACESGRDRRKEHLYDLERLIVFHYFLEFRFFPIGHIPLKIPWEKQTVLMDWHYGQLQ